MSREYLFECVLKLGDLSKNLWKVREVDQLTSWGHLLKYTPITGGMHRPICAYRTKDNKRSLWSCTLYFTCTKCMEYSPFIPNLTLGSGVPWGDRTASEVVTCNLSGSSVLLSSQFHFLQSNNHSFSPFTGHARSGSCYRSFEVP